MAAVASRARGLAASTGGHREGARGPGGGLAAIQRARMVAAHPGASNRQVGDASGVADQGQISKLLARLEHLGLICNAGSGAMRGEPNAWSLTAKGEEVERAISRQTPPVGD